MIFQKKMAASYQIIQNGQPTRNTFFSHGNGHLPEEINFRLNAKATSENSFRKLLKAQTQIDDLASSKLTLLSNGRCQTGNLLFSRLAHCSH
jgi:hypothetical protein